MVNLRIILVNPEYQQNIGYCARIIKNFGFNDLWIVSGPKIGQEAIKYSKHAADVLNNVKAVKSLDTAIKDCSIVIGTTAIEAAGKNILRNSITPKELTKQIKGNSEKVAILIGSEGKGLDVKDLEKCDIIVRIPANEEYGTLNISHALAIILYELNQKRIGEPRSSDFIDPHDRKFLISSIDSAVSKMSGLKNSNTIKLAVRRVIYRGVRSPIEGRALIQFLKNLNKNKK